MGKQWSSSVLWLLVTTNIPSLLILVTLMMEAIRSSIMSLLTRTTWHNIPEDGILYLSLAQLKFEGIFGLM
jgi:hypothetical protein